MNSIIKFSPNQLLRCFSFVVAVAFVSSCRKGDHINFPKEEKPITMEMTDTVTVIASTYLLDSLPTSNTGSILLGQVDDPDFGKTRLSSYFQVGLPVLNNGSIPEDALFDSLNLVLKYNKYVYGDTNGIQQFSAHQLTKRIKLIKVEQAVEPEERPIFVKEEALYSTSKFAYDPLPLGEVSLLPKPFSSDSLAIPLKKALGQELLKMLIDKDTRLNNNEDFLNYFRGLVLTAGSNGKSIVGFDAEKAKIVLYYNYKGPDGFPKKGTVQLNLNDKQYQFNHVDADRNQTRLQALNYHSRELSAEATNKELFVQAGTGIVARLALPGLTSFLQQPGIGVNAAELVIETESSSYKVFKAPQELNLFISNARNTPTQVLTNADGKSIQMAKFQPGNDAGSKAKYVFQLGGYIDALRKGKYKNTALMLSLPFDPLTKTVDRLRIANGESIRSIKVKIFYTKF